MRDVLIYFRLSIVSCLLGLLLSISGVSHAAENYSPNVVTSEGKTVLWGDTHLHTTLSLDAKAFGVKLDLEEAYRFARGEQVESTHGLKVKLARPLDFLVITDHSDAMGAMSEIIDGNEKFLSNDIVARWNKRLKSTDKTEQLKTRMEVMSALTDGSAPDLLFDKNFFTGIWNKYTTTADAYNEPKRFTALIGFEWTSSPEGSNLHRNVIYRDGAKLASQVLPHTTTESQHPEDLWAWMGNYEEETGGKLLALAHNGNISNGLMFPEINPRTGEPLDAEYVKTRARWEPMYEVTQIKGDGETHPFLSKNDEFANYETWDRANFRGVVKTKDMLEFEYARAALRRGLKLEKGLGTNPYEFGLIGSTDSHTGLATAEENNFFGKMSYMEPSATRWSDTLGKVGDFVTLGWQMTGSGYAAVWAKENTREAIFDALMRRETYATTGPRITVHFDADYNNRRQPMGGKFSLDKNASAPSFMIRALKDPMGANLDRVQVVKGWLKADGSTDEKIYNVAWAGNRKLSKLGKLKPIKSTVDESSATYNNSVGAVQLITEWKDPDFDPKQSSFYYLRVLQIPTPRWTAYDAQRYDIKMNLEVPMTTQERAYTSSIWFSTVKKKAR